MAVLLWGGGLTATPLNRRTTAPDTGGPLWLRLGRAVPRHGVTAGVTVP